MNKIELLAPAGNLECLKIAIDNGADAVYIGGNNFSARAYAENFNNEEIIEAIKYAHIRGSKVYVTINTLIHDNEFEDVLDFTDFLYLNDVDALIVADFGLINLLKNTLLSHNRLGMMLLQLIMMVRRRSLETLMLSLRFLMMQGTSDTCSNS